MIYQPYLLRQCSKCKKFFPAIYSFFKHLRKGKYGLNSVCRECERAANALYRKNHPDKAREASARYRENHPDRVSKYKKWERDNFPERSRARAKKYSILNREKERIRAREYRTNNPEKSHQISRRYRKRHPREYTVRSHKRISIARNLPIGFSNDDWWRALDFFNGRCAYCGNPPGLLPGMRLSQDHFIAITDPRPNNPGYTPGNILPACISCNSGKYNRNAEEWLIDRFGKHKARQILKRIAEYFESLKKP